MLDKNKTIVYGAVMDWDIGGAVATVVAFQTGDASLYISARTSLHWWLCA